MMYGRPDANVGDRGQRDQRLARLEGKQPALERQADGEHQGQRQHEHEAFDALSGPHMPAPGTNQAASATSTGFMPDVRSMVVARTEAVYRRSPRATAASQPDAAMPEGQRKSEPSDGAGIEKAREFDGPEHDGGQCRHHEDAPPARRAIGRGRSTALRSPADRKRQHRASGRPKVEPRAASAHGPLHAAAEERPLRTLMTDDVSECKRGAASQRQQR